LGAQRDDVLRTLRQVTDAAWVSIEGHAINDEILEVIAGLTELETLVIRELPGIDGDLSRLAALPTLRSLGLFDSELSPQVVAGIERLSHLRDLGVGGAAANDDAVRIKSRLRCLHSVSLQNCDVTPEGLAPLLDWQNLENIQISNSKNIDWENELLMWAQLPKNRDRYGLVKAYWDRFGDLGPYDDDRPNAVPNWQDQWASMSDWQRQFMPLSVELIEDEPDGGIAGGILVRVGGDEAYLEVEQLIDALARHANEDNSCVASQKLPRLESEAVEKGMHFFSFLPEPRFRNLTRDDVLALCEISYDIAGKGKNG
jgi:hypothetical protein